MASYSSSISPNKDRGPQLLAMYWTELSTVTIIVALRFYARIKINGLGLDDWTVLFTLVRKYLFP